MSTAEPVSRVSFARIFGFDVARSLAILGMVVVHFVLVMSQTRDQPSWLNTLLRHLDGRPATIFMMLAGIGVTLMSRHARQCCDPVAIAATRRSLVIRGLVLLVLGHLNLCVWQGDILRIYGVSLLLASRLFTVSDKALLAGSLAFVVGFMVLMGVFDFETNWDWETMHYRNLWTVQGLFRNLCYDGFRSVFPWSGLFLFGMWLGRRDWLEPRVNQRLLFAGLVTAVSAEVISALCQRVSLTSGLDSDTANALWGTESMPALPLFLLSSGGIAVAVIALCVRITARNPTTYQALADTGQLSLTWYFAHIFLGLGTVEALGLVGTQSPAVAVVSGVGFFLMAVLISRIWKSVYSFGPLESLMRWFAQSKTRQTALNQLS